MTSVRRWVSVLGIGVTSSVLVFARAASANPPPAGSSSAAPPPTSPPATGDAPTPAPPAPAPSASTVPTLPPALDGAAPAAPLPAEGVQPSAPGAPTEPSAASPASAPPGSATPAESSVTPSPAPAPPAQSPSAPPNYDELRYAFVHLASNYRDATLELRSFVDGDDWKAVCRVPCDQLLDVDGTEARVTAPGMTTSNVFRISPGRGRALLKVNGGSASTRSLGITLLVAGIPVSMVGGGLLGYGALEHENGLKIAGGVTLGVGAALVLTALPLLVSGGTDVFDGQGRQIAATPASSSAF